MTQLLPLPGELWHFKRGDSASIWIIKEIGDHMKLRNIEDGREHNSYRSEYFMDLYWTKITGAKELVPQIYFLNSSRGTCKLISIQDMPPAIYAGVNTNTDYRFNIGVDSFWGHIKNGTYTLTKGPQVQTKVENSDSNERETLEI